MAETQEALDSAELRPRYWPKKGHAWGGVPQSKALLTGYRRPLLAGGRLAEPLAPAERI